MHAETPSAVPTRWPKRASGWLPRNGHRPAWR
jgi:hypothetical protein